MSTTLTCITNMYLILESYYSYKLSSTDTDNGHEVNTDKTISRKCIAAVFLRSNYFPVIT